MVAFDKRIFVGTLWGTDLRFNAQTQQKAPQCVNARVLLRPDNFDPPFS